MDNYDQIKQNLEDDLKISQVAMGEAFVRWLPKMVRCAEFKKEDMDVIFEKFDAFNKEILTRTMQEIIYRTMNPNLD